MSAIFRRAYTTKTLIPPNVAAATRLSGSAKDGQISQLVSFYKVRFFFVDVRNLVKLTL